jgi:cytochrome c
LHESSYEGGKMGDFHPLSWYHEFDGGRAFYTGMGHTPESFSEQFFLDHLLGGIEWAMGSGALDYSKATTHRVPFENRFVKKTFVSNLYEPMEFDFLPDGKVLIVQRKGTILLCDTKTGVTDSLTAIPVWDKFEDGLMGIAVDPNYKETNWVYVYYSPPGDESINQISRFTFDGTTWDFASEKVIMKVETQRVTCCHSGGSLEFDRHGNLFLSTGDDTNPFASDGYAPIDERPGREPWDAQRTSSNTNDLRGKVLRIHPEPDGSYTIPEGNLFPEGTEKTRPEIYTMGHRNPFRISVDQRTGYVYWGEVGPDASKADDTRGPAGHDEVGQARKAGNYGWPHFVGDNKAYFKYDFANEKSLEKWDEAAPTNTSPNNTGLETLPPAQKAFIWYPYGESPEFPLVGTGGRNAMAGPVFYSDDFKGAERSFPDYYDGKLFTYDWIRGWIMSVTMDEEGNYVSMERFMPSYKFSNPMDMVFADNGDLYMLEYGTGWFKANDDARLIRIEFNAGNRKPQVQLAADKQGGSVPLAVSLSADGTTDADEDELTYSWKITSETGFNQTLKGKEVSITLEEEGIYAASLTVDDGAGGQSSQTLEIVAGNEAPVLTLELPQGNRSFFTVGQPINYEVKVNDKEDGSLDSGIAAERVAVSIDYFPEGYDQVHLAQGHRSADAAALFARGKKLITGSDCLACHKVNEKSIGPSYVEVAKKYKADAEAVGKLSDKIINGGSGVWGETAMAGHPSLSKEDAEEMVKYILSVSDQPAEPGLPVKGSYVAALPEGDKGAGVYVLRAAYSDNGANGLPALNSEKTLVLRNSGVDPHGFDEYETINKVSFNNANFAIPSKNGAYMGLNLIDLNHVSAVVISAMAPKPQLNALGGKVELHLDSPDGPLLGASDFLEPSEQMSFNPSQLTVPVALPDGFDGKPHDLYLVFVNEAAGDGSLMIVVRADFVLASGAMNF